MLAVRANNYRNPVFPGGNLLADASPAAKSKVYKMPSLFTIKLNKNSFNISVASILVVFQVALVVFPYHLADLGAARH